MPFLIINTNSFRTPFPVKVVLSKRTAGAVNYQLFDRDTVVL